MSSRTASRWPTWQRLLASSSYVGRRLPAVGRRPQQEGSRVLGELGINDGRLAFPGRVVGCGRQVFRRRQVISGGAVVLGWVVVPRWGIVPGGVVRSAAVPGERRQRQADHDGAAEWRATEAALAEIEAEIPYPLSQAVTDIETALRRKSFHDRIAEKLADDPAWN